MLKVLHGFLRPLTVKSKRNDWSIEFIVSREEQEDLEILQPDYVKSENASLEEQTGMAQLSVY